MEIEETKFNLHDLIKIYFRRFKKHIIEEGEREVVGQVCEIYEKQKYYSEFKPVYIYGMLWTKEGKLGRYYHASSVIKITNGRETEYLEIEHIGKGRQIITITTDFPKEKHPELKNYYINGDGDMGGIVCQGKANARYNVLDILEAVLGWWYILDVVKRTDRFPGSCTGLTEFVLYKFMVPEVRESCLNIYPSSTDVKLLSRPPYPEPDLATFKIKRNK
jgi:hypothetical protein